MKGEKEEGEAATADKGKEGEFHSFPGQGLPGVAKHMWLAGPPSHSLVLHNAAIAERNAAFKHMLASMDSKIE